MLDVLAEAVTSLAVAQLLTAVAGPPSRFGWISRLSVVIILLQVLRFLLNQVTPPIEHARFVTKFLLLTICHTSAACVECHVRYQTRLGPFARHLFASVLYVLPCYPILMVSGSTLLMIGTSALRIFGISHEVAEWLVQLGSLHAPFFFVVLHTNRLARCSRGCYDSLDLPLTHSNHVDHALVRQMRMRAASAERERGRRDSSE